jgi:pimeloyl-ACP methyl ester carboxylesterase
MAEWLKAHAWKACVRETVPWVRIPLSPPAAQKNPHNKTGHSGRKRSAAHDEALTYGPAADDHGRFVELTQLRVKGFIIQNANAYMEGVGDAPKGVLLPLWEKRAPETEKAPREFVGLEGTKFHWLVGAKDPEAINPDNWVLDQALLDRPDVQDYQVDLLENHKTNIALYPEWQAAFRAHRPKTLIVWGKHDPFFIPPGARAYLNDLPDARLVWLDAGHFVLDENAPQVAAEIKAAFAA